jgi:outer membrane protein
MTRTIKTLIVLGLTLGLSAAAAGQDKQEKIVLTLDESLRLALLQNPFFLAEKAKEDQASAVVRQAVAGFMPSLNAQGSDILDKKVFSVIIPPLFPGMTSQSVKFDFTRTYQMTLNFSVPLYAGGRIVSGYKQANYNLESTREGIRRARQETVYNVKQAFYGYLLAREFESVAREAVTLAEKHLKTVRSLYDVGMASKFDLLRTEVQLANLQPQLIKAKNGLASAELGLKTLLGIDLGRPVEVSGTLGFQDVTADVEASIVQALAARPDLNQLKYQQSMASEMLKSARAAYLPTLAIGGQYNSWSNDFKFTKGNWDNYYSVNLVLSFSIFNGFANAAKVGESKAILRQLELSQKGLADAIKFEIQNAILKLRQARESLVSQEKNVEQAQEAVRIAELNYSEGMATNLDVSSAQVALSQARTNYSQGLFDYAMALAELEKAVGAGADEPASK